MAARLPSSRQSQRIQFWCSGLGESWNGVCVGMSASRIGSPMGPHKNKLGPLWRGRSCPPVSYSSLRNTPRVKNYNTQPACAALKHTMEHT